MHRNHTIFFLSILFIITACNIPIFFGGSQAEKTPENSSATNGSSSSQEIAVDKSTGQIASQSCILGAWQVDVDSYVSWMNANGDRSPSVLFTKIDPPFHYQFNSDWTFTISVENVSLFFDAIDPKTGKSAGTFEIITNGKVTGTIAKLDPEKDHPGVALITFHILDNQTKVIDVKFNDRSIAESPPNTTPLIEPSFFSKVGYTCQGDSLGLLPIAAGLPGQGFSLTRDTHWTISNP